MKAEPLGSRILIINGGSSSIKFAFYETRPRLRQTLYGKVDRIGLSGTTLAVTDSSDPRTDAIELEGVDYATAAAALVDWLESQNCFSKLVAIGHRIVHGMRHTAPELVTPELLDELNRLSPIDPEHLPGEIEIIEVFRRRHPNLPQMVCFDTAFHRTMPRVAKLLPIPRRFDRQGVQRYGFHGLSCEFLMQELSQIGDPTAKAGRIILAHVGNGASLTAVRDGQCIDTSMGFTPTGGLPMGSRSGDLDPGLVNYLACTEQMTAIQFHHMVNHESGLLGVSETSTDVRDLLVLEASDIRAAEALELFCYQIKKWIGGFAASLGGLDTLVFAGGIGENSPIVRWRICHELEFLGIQLAQQQNAASDAVISTATSRVTVRVIRTDEELMIAKAVCGFLSQ